MPVVINRYRNRYRNQDRKTSGTSIDRDSDPDCDSDPGPFTESISLDTRACFEKNSVSTNIDPRKEYPII